LLQSLERSETRGTKSMSATEWAWIKAGSARSAIDVVVMRIMPCCDDEEQGRL
jgi:hypothetical protein